MLTIRTHVSNTRPLLRARVMTSGHSSREAQLLEENRRLSQTFDPTARAKLELAIEALSRGTVTPVAPK